MAARKDVGAGRRRSISLADIFRGSLLPLTVAVTLMNACTMFAWWGFNLWIPAYLSLPVADGGIGLSTAAMSGFIIAMQIGMWFGYVTFGFVSDALGRRRTYLIYLCVAAVLIFAYGTTTQYDRAPAARAVRRVFRDRVLQRLRRGDG